jgi:hypothetical protein
MYTDKLMSAEDLERYGSKWSMEEILSVERNMKNSLVLLKHFIFT